MRPQPIPTWLEDAAETVGRLLRTDGEILQTVDLVERTGLSAHRVSSALQLLVDLGTVERTGRRESSFDVSITNLLPGGQVQPSVMWSTQFYYQWVGERSAAAGTDFGVSDQAPPGSGAPAAAPPAHQEEGKG